MVQRICPICDQVMKHSHYCRNCRSWVRQPFEREVTYYLNERHPENETACSYHGRGMPEDRGRTEADKRTASTYARSQVTGNTAGWIAREAKGSGAGDVLVRRDIPDGAGYRNQSHKSGNPVLRAAAIIVAVILAAFLFQTGVGFARRQIFSQLAGKDTFAYDKEANPWEMEGDYEEGYPGGEDWWDIEGEYPGIEDWWNDEEGEPGQEEWWQLEPRELTDEEAIALGMTCQGDRHFTMQGPELEEAIRRISREQGCQEVVVRQDSSNRADLREDGECMNSFFSTEADFSLIRDRGILYVDHVVVDYDTVSGELHAVEILMQNQEGAIEMAAGILEEIEKECGRKDGLWSKNVRQEMLSQMENGEWYDWASEDVWISGIPEEDGRCWISIDVAE